MRSPIRPPHPLGLDRLGISASVACVLHCTALPLVAMALPAAGAAWELATWLGWAAVATAALVAGLTLPRGFSRHRNAEPGGLAAFGILGLVAGEFLAGPGLGWAAALTMAGGLAVVTAQLRNLQLLRQCQLCGHSHWTAPVQPPPIPISG